MKRKAMIATLIMSLGLAVNVNAQEETEWPFGVATEDVTIYTRPDHMYTALENYSDNVVYDLPYCGENSTDSQKLHLVFPDEEHVQDGKLPVLVFIHGGGWSFLNSVEHNVSYTGEGALWALDRGYAVAFVDYTLVDEEHTGMPNQIYEVKAAIRYLRSIAETYNLDADKIAAMGESAGGHLVNMLGTTAGEVEYDYSEYGNMDYSSDVQAVISQYSVADIASLPEVINMTYGVDSESLPEEELQKKLYECSPLEHIDGNEPPFFIETGLEDSEVPYIQSCSLYNAIMMNNIEQGTELHLFPGMNHAVTWFQTEENAEIYLDWLDQVFER